MDPDVALRVILRGLLDVMELRGFGEDVAQEASGVEEFEGAAGSALGEDAGEFVAGAFEGDLGDFGGLRLDGAEGGGI